MLFYNKSALQISWKIPRRQIKEQTRADISMHTQNANAKTITEREKADKGDREAPCTDDGSAVKIIVIESRRKTESSEEKERNQRWRKSNNTDYYKTKVKEKQARSRFFDPGSN